MGWEWRVFYNIRREGHNGSLSLSKPLPELLKLGNLTPENDPRTDEYFLLDFPGLESSAHEEDEEDDSAEISVGVARTPHAVGLKLRGGVRAGLEIKCRLEKKRNLKCEKWKKFVLSPDLDLPEGGLQGFSQGPDYKTQLLKSHYHSGLSPLLPLEHLKVIGVAKITKQRSQRNHKGVLVEHTLVRLESDTLPGVVVLAESLGVDGKKDELKEYIRSKKLKETAEKAHGLVMAYPQLLHHLFVARDVQI